MKIRITSMATGVLLVMSTGHALADVTLNHVDRGAFVNPLLTGSISTASDGFKSGTTPGSGNNYLLRAINSGFLTSDPADDFPVESDRNYHAFDLTGLSGTISGATLRIWADVGAYDSSAGSETAGLFSVSTPASVLDDPLSDTVAAAGAFLDLGSGTSYGSFVTSAADDSSYIDVVLNAAAIADLNAAIGGSWSVGGALQSIDGSYNVAFNLSERVLKNDSSTASEPPAQLVLTGSVVPEPSSLVLLGFASAALLATRRRL